MSDVIGICAVGQKLNLLIEGVGGAENIAKFVGCGLEEFELTKLSPQVVGILGITQQEFFELRRAEYALKFSAGLLPQAGHFRRIRGLARVALRFEIGFQTVLGTFDDIFD